MNCSCWLPLGLWPWKQVSWWLCVFFLIFSFILFILLSGSEMILNSSSPTVMTFWTLMTPYMDFLFIYSSCVIPSLSPSLWYTPVNQIYCQRCLMNILIMVIHKLCLKKSPIIMWPFKICPMCIIIWFLSIYLSISYRIHQEQWLFFTNSFDPPFSALLKQPPVKQFAYPVM